MASFRLKFEQGLLARGMEVTYDLSARSDAVLVIAGTRFLPGLYRVRQRGIRIVQRLDGINWVQRVKWSGLKYSLRAEYGNFLLALIRARFADRVIYQSHFIRQWWENWYGAAKVPAFVIFNGVDLNTYTPDGDHDRPATVCRMMLIEGSLARGLNSGLFHAVAVAEKLSEKIPVEVVVAGTVDDATRKQLNSRVPVKFLGTVPRSEIPRLARSSHLMYCAEVNPPCPNSVIEALACGLPVAGFESGALKELVSDQAGWIVPYGANPWKLETPDILTLADSVKKMLSKQGTFSPAETMRTAARKYAEKKFDLEKMVDSYLKVLLDD